jgi:hypothetical protein
MGDFIKMDLEGTSCEVMTVFMADVMAQWCTFLDTTFKIWVPQKLGFS